MNYCSSELKVIETDLLTGKTRIVKPAYISDYFRESGHLKEAQVRYTGKVTVEVDFTISGDAFSDNDDPGPEILGNFFEKQVTFGKVTNQDIKMEIISCKHSKLLD